MATADRRVPTLPRGCVEHRLAVLDALSTAVTNDAIATAEELVDRGCSLEQAVDIIRRGYADWLLSIFTNAIDLGAGCAEATLADAAA